jgi:hypothetical protein
MRSGVAMPVIRGEGEAPGVQVGGEPAEDGRQGCTHGRCGLKIRHGPLPRTDPDSIADVDEGGWYHRHE